MDFSFSKKTKAVALAAVAISTMSLSYKADDISHLLQGNLVGSVDSLSHAPIDGFEPSPIPLTANWAKVGYNSNSVPYKDFKKSDLITPPPYDINVIRSGRTDAEAINTKTTYTVVNSGDYSAEKSITEFSGGHTGVDIVAPPGTPLVAVANGIVVKKEDITTGFGKNLSILHKNAPADPTKTYLVNKSKRDYIVSYAHLSSFAAGIEEGDEVKRGQVIGYVGDTGTATTSHVHFQIQEVKMEVDTKGTTEKTPFIMYWGGNPENNRKFTINPLLYLQSNAYGAFNNSNSSGTSNPDSNNSGGSTVQTPDPVPEEPKNPEPEPEKEDSVEEVESTPLPSSGPGIDTGLLPFDLKGATSALANGSGSVLTITDSLNSMASLDKNVELKVEVSGVGKVKPSVLTSSDFKKGKATVYFSSNESGMGHITVGKSTHSVTYFNRGEIGGTEKLDLEFEGDVYQNTVHTLYVKALDLEDRPTPLTSFPGEIQFDVSQGSATFNPSSLRSSDFEGGVAKVQVTTGSDDSLELRARAGAIVSEKERFRLRAFKAFSDVPNTHPNAKAIYALREAGVISGNPDGTFDPNEPINRVATLKILMLAAGVSTEDEAELNFKDIEKQAWYIPTLMAAVNLGIVEGYPDGTFGPERNINNAELAKVLLESFGVEPTENLKTDPYEDVSVRDWFAKYAYIINKRNLKDTPNNRYEPARPATRAEVAEMAYRLKVLLEQNMVSYAGI